MKHSFLFIAAAILLMAVSCKENTILPDSTSTDTYIGKWYVASTGNLYYTVSDSAKTLPLAMVDTMIITASDKSGYCHVKCGKVDEDAQVTSSGLQIPSFEKNDTISGLAYQVSYDIIIKNEPAKVALGVMEWKSTITGSISGETIGAEASYSVTGDLTNRAVKKN